MRRIAIGLVLMMLAACGGGGYVPPPSGPPAPPPTGTLIFSADWTPPIGIAFGCQQGNPLSCADLPAGAKWAAYPQCVDPTPNVCFQPVAALLGWTVTNGGADNGTPGGGGMALLSATTIAKDRPFSIFETVTIDTLNCSRVGYHGPVAYNGEGAAGDPTGNYRSAYISCAGDSDTPKLWVYGPTYAGPMNSAPVSIGVPHTIGIIWNPGVSITYTLDGVVQLVETPGSLSIDPLTLNQDPHPSLWFGASTGRVGRFDVYQNP